MIIYIQDVNFQDGTKNDAAEAYVNLGKKGNTNTRYTNNVTVKNCTFNGNNNELVAIKSYTGGDKNLNVIGCTVNTGIHSMLQVSSVEEGLKIADCKVYSKNGVNLNSTPSLEMSGCTFDIKGYAIRFGTNDGVNAKQYTFNVSNSTLKSACEDGDAVIMFRSNATYAILNLTDTTLEGTTKISGQTEATTINGSY